MAATSSKVVQLRAHPCNRGSNQFNQIISGRIDNACVACNPEFAINRPPYPLPLSLLYHLALYRLPNEDSLRIVSSLFLHFQFSRPFSYIACASFSLSFSFLQFICQSPSVVSNTTDTRSSPQSRAVRRPRRPADNLWAPPPPPTFVDRRAAADNLSIILPLLLRSYFAAIFD